MVGKISSEEKYFGIIEKLKDEVVRAERLEREEELRREMMKEAARNVRDSKERIEYAKAGFKGTYIEEVRRCRDCFCGKFDHMARDCYI